MKVMVLRIIENRESKSIAKKNQNVVLVGAHEIKGTHFILK